jgi:tetratricopeptide (TPR) repeat protein
MIRIVSAVAIAIATALAIDAANADAAFMPASVPSGEIHRWTQEFAARSLQPQVAEMIFLLSCLTDVAAAHFESAERNCSEAIHHEPDNPGPYKLRGEASLFLGRLEYALVDLNQAIDLDATDPESYAARGQAYRLLRNYRLAIADFDTAIALAPQNPAYWNGRCWIRAEANRELRIALKDCKKVQRLSPQFFAAFDSGGLVYLRLRQFTRAIRDYSTAIRLHSDYATAYFGRGLANLHLARIASGQRDIRKARQLDPDIDSYFARMGVTGHGLAMPRAGRPAPSRDERLPMLKDTLARR